jgi:hypothetical protein
VLSAKQRSADRMETIGEDEVGNEQTCYLKENF